MTRIPSLAGVGRDPVGVTITTDRGLTDQIREQIMTWLLANDINPATMPEDNTIRIQDGLIAYTEHRKNADDQWIRDGEGKLARYVVTAPVVEPVPAEPWPMEA